MCPSSEELPYVMDEGIKLYFKLIWQNAHLYHVEKDYTLALIALSPQALQNGVMAPKRITTKKKPEGYQLFNSMCGRPPRLMR